jgi:hypothetical protein
LKSIAEVQAMRRVKYRGWARENFFAGERVINTQMFPHILRLQAGYKYACLFPFGA